MRHPWFRYDKAYSDYFINLWRLELQVHRRGWRGHWGIGRTWGDGAFAIHTPWISLYPW